MVIKGHYFVNFIINLFFDFVMPMPALWEDFYVSFRN